MTKYTHFGGYTQQNVYKSSKNNKCSSSSNVLQILHKTRPTKCVQQSANGSSQINKAHILMVTANARRSGVTLNARSVRLMICCFQRLRFVFKLQTVTTRRFFTQNYCVLLENYFLKDFHPNTERTETRVKHYQFELCLLRLPLDSYLTRMENICNISKEKYFPILASGESRKHFSVLRQFFVCKLTMKS